MTQTEKRTMRDALSAAIEWEYSLLEVHLEERKGKVKPRRGSADVVRDGRRAIKRYYKLLDKIR